LFRIHTVCQVASIDYLAQRVQLARLVRLKGLFKGGDRFIARFACLQISGKGPLHRVSQQYEQFQLRVQGLQSRRHFVGEKQVMHVAMQNYRFVAVSLKVSRKPLQAFVEVLRLTEEGEILHGRVAVNVRVLRKPVVNGCRPAFLRAD